MNTFEDYLMEKHCESETHLPKDVLVDDFNDWVSERLDIDDLIKYGDDFAKLKNKELMDEIEKKIEELGIQTDKADTQIQNEDFNEFFSKEDAEKLIHDNLIIIKALEDIKNLLK